MFNEEALHELIEAVKEWESAECTDCPARFATEREAREHQLSGHSVFAFYGERAVN